MADRPQGRPVDVNPANLLGLIKDESVFPGIRAEAIRALLEINSEVAIKDQALDYFRNQSRNPTSELFDSSLTALASIGNDTTDRQIVMENLKSTSYDRQLSAVRAIEVGQLTAGISGLADLVKSEADPSVKMLAIQALATFAQRNDKGAITALNELGLRDADRASRVNAQSTTIPDNTPSITVRPQQAGPTQQTGQPSRRP